METSLSSRGGGVEVQGVLVGLVAERVRSRDFECNVLTSGHLGTGFVRNTEAVCPGWGRRDAHG